MAYRPNDPPLDLSDYSPGMHQDDAARAPGVGSHVQTDGASSSLQPHAVNSATSNLVFDHFRGPYCLTDFNDSVPENGVTGLDDLGLAYDFGVDLTPFSGNSAFTHPSDPLPDLGCEPLPILDDDVPLNSSVSSSSNWPHPGYLGWVNPGARMSMNHSSPLYALEPYEYQSPGFGIPDATASPYTNPLATGLGTIPTLPSDHQPYASSSGDIGGMAYQTDQSNGTGFPGNGIPENTVRKSNTKSEVAGRSTKPRSKCSQCSKTFSRAADLDRHSQKHRSGDPAYQCGVAGCGYGGSYRRDKIRSHLKNCHLQGRDFFGEIAIGDYFVPANGDCTLSTDCLISSAFMKREWSWSKVHYSPMPGLDQILTEDHGSIKALTKADVKCLMCNILKGRGEFAAAYWVKKIERL